MAEKDKKDDPKPWTPDQPLPDEDDEKEAQVRAQRAARVKHLEDSFTKPPTKKDKKMSW